jgi:ABC-type transport system involved in multi-copper enzyme maturation permease subunit
MFFVIIVKEIRHNILTLRFAVVYALLFVLTVVSMAMLSANYSAQWENYVRSKARQREVLNSMESVEDLRHQGVSVQKEPSKMSIFSLGLDKEMSRSAFVSSRGGVEIGASQYPNPISALFSTPDLSYIVNIVISLLALLLAFDTICGENEEGTLRLMLANSVPRDIILIGKWVGGYLGVAVPFLIAVGVGLIVSLLITDLSLDGDTWMRAGALLLLSLLYISVFFAAGVLISTFTKRASTALMASLFFWVLVVLTIPNVVPILARQIVGIPSLGVLSGQKRSIENEQWSKIREKMRTASSDPERRRIHTDLRESVTKEWERIEEGYEAKIDRQIELAGVLSRISPSACFVYAATNLAGTGIVGFRGLADYTKRYEGEFREAVREIQRDAQAQQQTQAVEQRLNAPAFDIQKLPEFKPPTESFARSLNDSLLDVALLGLLNIAFFLGSYIKFMRYDVCE